MKIGDLFIQLGLKDAEFQKGLRSAETSLKSFNRSMGGVVKFLDKQVTRAFKGATLAVTAFGAASMKTGAEFEQAITEVAAISGATGQELQGLEDKARQLGSTTLFTATESANAMKEFARAGMDANEIVAATGPAMLLAGSAGADMTTSTKLLAATLAQFSLEAGEAGRVSDVMSMALRSSLFDMESLSSAMRYGGTVGAGFGYQLEETVAALAEFRNMGLEGSLAGTQLRMALAAAAKPTRKAEEALAKYGLTAEDVNPELNTFREIMVKVGESGMTTTDAIRIFTQRAGANVVAVARKFADGTSKFDETLAKLEESAGATQSVYDQMTDTVLSQAKIALSALDELFITLFDTYRKPLKELLTAIADTIAYVAEVVQLQSTRSANSLRTMFDRMTDWMRANRELIAVVFVEMMTDVARLLEMLGRYSSELITIGQLMVSAFAATKVMALVGGFQSLVAVVVRASSAVNGLTTAMTLLNSAKGGPAGLIAGLVTAAAAMATFAAKTTLAEQAARKLADAEKAVADQLSASDRIMREYAASVAETQHDGVNALLDKMDAEDESIDKLYDHAEALQALTEEQIASGIESGKLFQTIVDGNKIVIDHEAAVRMAAAGMKEGESALKDLDVQYSGALKTQEQYLDQYAKGYEALEKYENLKAAGKIREAELALHAVGGTVEHITAQTRHSQAMYEQWTEKVANLSGGLKSATARLNKERKDAARQATKEEKTQEELNKELERGVKLSNELAEATAKRVEMTRALEKEVQRAGAFGDEKLLGELDLEDRIDEVSAAFDEEIALAQRAGSSIEAIESEKFRALGLVRKAYLLDMKSETMAAEREVAESIRQLRLDIERDMATERASIDMDRQEALVEAVSATQEQLNDINAHYDLLQLRRRQRLSSEVMDLVNEENAEIIQLARDRDYYLSELDEDQHGERILVTQFYNRKIGEAEDDLKGKRKANRREERKGLYALRDATLRAARGIYQGMRRISSSLLDLFKGVTDATLAPMDAVRELVDAEAKRVELQGQLDSGQITQAEFDEGVADLPEDMAAGARAAAAELVGGASTFMQALSVGLPEFFRSLAAEIPALTQAMKESLPGLAQALGEAIAELAPVLARLAVDFITVMVQQAPRIIRAIVQELPAIIQQLARAVRVLIAGVGEVVAQLVAELPRIVRLLAAELPAIILQIASSLSQVLRAVVEMLPDLVKAIIRNLPALIGALADGVMMIVGEVVRSFAQLIPMLVAAVPRLVGALVKSAGLIIQAVAAALPDLMGSLALLAADLVTNLIKMVPRLLTSVVRALPVVFRGVLMLIPKFILGLARALPAIIPAFVKLMPRLIVIFISQLIPALFKSSWRILKALLTELPKALAFAMRDLAVALADAVLNALKKMVQFFKDVITEILTLGKKKTRTFGDTPGAVKAGSGGMTARFSPNDYVIAAQNPLIALSQALKLAQGAMASGAGRIRATLPQASVPGGEALAVAMLQAADAMSKAVQGGGGMAGALSVTVKADGRVLDESLYVAGRRGGSPRLDKRIRSSRLAVGVHAGFDRGSYSGS